MEPQKHLRSGCFQEVESLKQNSLSEHEVDGAQRRLNTMWRKCLCCIAKAYPGRHCLLPKFNFLLIPWMKLGLQHKASHASKHTDKKPDPRCSACRVYENNSCKHYTITADGGSGEAVSGCSSDVPNLNSSITRCCHAKWTR